MSDKSNLPQLSKLASLQVFPELTGGLEIDYLLTQAQIYSSEKENLEEYVFPLDWKIKAICILAKIDKLDIAFEMFPEKTALYTFV